MPWSAVERVVETERLLLIYHGFSSDPFYVPKHALEPLTADRLFSLLREQRRLAHNNCSYSRGLPNRHCSRRWSYGTRRGTRCARVHGAILLDPPQLL